MKAHTSPTDTKNTKPKRWVRKFPFNASPEVRVNIFGILFAVVIVSFAGFVALYTARLPYYAVAPGSVHAVSQAIRISESDQYPLYPNQQGGFGFVTASVSGRLSPLEWINSKFTEGAQIFHVNTLGEDPPSNQERQITGRIQIINSQMTSVLLAFELLGIEVQELPEGLRIAEISECSGSLNILQPNDVIIGGEGQQIVLQSQLADLLTNKSAGDNLSLTVRRGVEQLELNFTLNARNEPCLLEFFNTDTSSPGEATDTTNNSPAIGITLIQIIRIETPIDVEFFTGNIGGPSAGLSFTLGLLDILEPGDLTGGKRIAATGTIDRSGRIGDIGGVQEKMISVKRQGYDLFFVPKNQLDQIKNIDSSLEVIGVETITDVLVALIERGGDPLDTYSGFPVRQEI